MSAKHLLVSIISILLISSVLAQVGGDVRTELEQLESEHIRANSYRLFFISLTALRFTPATPDTVLLHSEYSMSGHGRTASALLNEWKRITRVSEGEIDFQPDVCIVFQYQETTLAFTASGEFGYVNGKAVRFSRTSRGWFAKYMLPLAKTLYALESSKPQPVR